MQLYNTASRTVETFEPLHPPIVTLYACGPTVYDYTHIGHLRKYTNDDLLKRTLTYLGYKVNHVVNITDVGHLESDEDQGEDKLEKGAQKMGKTVYEVASFFTQQFLASIDALGILHPDKLVKATDHIEDMITLITRLEKRGHTYTTKEAVYFDTTTYRDYGKLSGQKLSEKKQQARGDVYLDTDKKHPADFVLWFKRTGRFAKHTMHWNSPWGDGFPGWHIECSAMSMKYLGTPIDIHTGGVDHIPVHHENEIAQSQCATGGQFVRFWFHSEFLLVDGQKMSKSKENFYTIEHITKKSIDPLALRYLYMQTHYRKQLNFTFESLNAAHTSLQNLRDAVAQLRHQTQRTQLSEEKLHTVQSFSDQFRQTLSTDLQMPLVLSLVWEVVKSNIPSRDKLDLLLEFDTVLGLGLAQVSQIQIPPHIEELRQKREKARAAGDFIQSDELRVQTEHKGYTFEDSTAGTTIKKLR